LALPVVLLLLLLRLLLLSTVLQRNRHIAPQA
jgi:hypothetical protein